MEHIFNTQNTCAKAIKFDLDGNIVKNVRFLGGGCPGNLQAIPKLVEGMTVEEVIKKLKGITCGVKGTSCADQLAKGLEEIYTKSQENK